MGSIFEILDVIACTKKRSVIATVIMVEGSAYRKEGTSMLFLEDGRQIGMISGGCLEYDLAIQANVLLNNGTGNSRTVVYDMSAEDDLSWGRGAGCNGTVHILLEKVDAKLGDLLCTIKSILDQGKSVYALKTVKKDNVRTTCITKEQYYSAHNNANQDPLINLAQQKVKSRIQAREDLETYVYYHQFIPKPRLFIFGAGADVRPFASIAAKTGFAVNIWDWRPAYLKQTYFPDTRFILGNSISEAIKSIQFSSGDSVIVMTHDYQKDKELLHFLLQSPPLSYLGILGPRKRTSRLLDGGTIPERLHSPVGLSIGADGPEEIAIAIIADLIRFQRQVSVEKEISHEHNWYLSSSGKE